MALSIVRFALAQLLFVALWIAALVSGVALLGAWMIVLALALPVVVGVSLLVFRLLQPVPPDGAPQTVIRFLAALLIAALGWFAASYVLYQFLPGVRSDEYGPGFFVMARNIALPLLSVSSAGLYVLLRGVGAGSSLSRAACTPS